MFRRGWDAAGIHSIQDICHPSEGRLLSHSELSENYGVACSFLDMLSLRLGVPLSWRQTLTNNFSPQADPTAHSGVYVSLPNEQPRDIINVNLNSCTLPLSCQNSTAFKRWVDSPDPSLKISGEEEGRDLSLNVYRATRETKLQSLNFRITNHIVPCRKFLKQIRLIDSDLCEICAEQDSLSHFFRKCPQVRLFWASFAHWFDRIDDLCLGDLPTKNILLGLPPQASKARKVNAILISV